MRIFYAITYLTLIAGVFGQDEDIKEIGSMRGFKTIPRFVINGLKKMGLTTVCELEVALEEIGGNVADLAVPRSYHSSLI